MAFLKLLESIRAPILTAFFSGVTYLGSEGALLALVLLLYWCVSKRRGVFALVVGLGGTCVNQAAKLIFRVPRPWVRDESFTIVESARADAGGYSFPSGHSQNAGSLASTVFATTSRKIIRVLCVLLFVLVPFSRMYLGVHTPADVLTGAGLALLFTLALYPFFRTEEMYQKWGLRLVGLCALLCAVYAVWVNTAAFPADIDADNLAEGVRNGWSLLGATAGMFVGLLIEQRKVRFSTEAPLPAQILKLVLGVACVLLLRTGLKKLFAIVLPYAFSGGIRYFVMTVFAACVWPLTFPWFVRLCSRKR